MKNSSFLSIDNLSPDDFDENAELIPLMTPEDEEEINKESLPEAIPILPLRNTVLFPGVVVPITAGRDKSIELLNEANRKGRSVGVLTQIDEAIEDPSADDLYRVGTVARILRILKMPDGNITAILQGKKRFKLRSVVSETPYLKVSIEDAPQIKPKPNDSEFNAIIESIKELSLKIIKDSPNIPSEASIAIKNIESHSFLVSFVCSNMNLDVAEKQKLLETNNLKDRALATLKYLNTELQKLELKIDIQSRVQNDINQQQREYFLHQQMRTIQEELGDVGHDSEVEEMIKKSKKKKWSKEVKTHFDKEMSRLRRMNPQAPDYSVQRNYLDLFLDLPWHTYSKDKFDLKRAQRILNRDHYGLDDVKKRIVEHLAVLKLRNDMKSPILCFYGPPGVGKTSLGKSIAEALGRKFARMSLGGMRDEAEIRGHRKTYIGAMPGRILQNLKKVQTSNPVFILDEIDKLGNSYQGDPSSAMLELLDPEQNDSFYDNFLELGYDLSKVMFIATANSLYQIHPALLDRMELINISGYTLEEKVEIAKRHLMPKILKAHGMSHKHLSIGKPQIAKVAEGYTRESGVRGLEKQLAKIVRHTAKKIALEEPYQVKVDSSYLIEVLKSPKMDRAKYENNDIAGVVTGLAWTSVGGEILFIESNLSKGKGRLNITGNLGKVMRESASLALQYIKSNADKYGINPDIFEKYDVHIHVPEGATPKDGPSAGITILTSLASVLTQRKVKRNLAMTGEITLRGRVLPVGGIKEKILAAKRAKIKDIVLSAENKRDVDEIKDEYLKGLTFHYASKMEEAINFTLLKQKVKDALSFKD